MMHLPRYSPPTLFYKLSTDDQTVIIKGFTEYYISRAKDAKKYDTLFLEEQISSHFELYHETRLFNDIELVNLVEIYTTLSLDETIIIEKYPELFV